MDKVFEYDDILWGKSEPFEPLSMHMIAVGACAMAYLQAPSSSGILDKLSRWLSLSPEETVRCVAYAFSLHDLGKAHPAFQFLKQGVYEKWVERGYKDGEFICPHFRHEEYVGQELKRLWAKTRFPGKDGNIFLAAVRFHHQGKTIDPAPKPPSCFREIQKELEQRMRLLFQPPQGRVQAQNVNALGILTLSLLILCDWVASWKGFWDGIKMEGDQECLRRALDCARSRLSEFGLVSGHLCAFPEEEDFCAFWPRIPRAGLRPLQRVCQTISGRAAQLTIIEAPMGEGKTEAALYLAGGLCKACGKQGIYMALPTAATSNQMYGRVRQLLCSHGLENVRLLHSMAWLMDEKTPSEGQFASEDGAQAAEWLSPLRRGMLSENAVGTVDQAMAAVLRLKYGSLRLMGLTRKILIIDEIHACDVYMAKIVARLLEWCKALEIPVILLSATLQERQKRRYIQCFTGQEPPNQAAYPLITQVLSDGTVRCTPVESTYMRNRFAFRAFPGLGDVEQIARLAVKKVEQGGCLCVMMNTVGRAQQVYQAIKQMGMREVMLFHARFPMGRRNQIEQEVLERFGKDAQRPERMILVCTQVVEQSLDVDFDGMITELAPVDLLLQRAGRVYRYQWLRRPLGLQSPMIEVAVPSETAPKAADRRYGVLSAIYPESVLWNTEQWLGQGREVRVPEDVRDCVDTVYTTVDETVIDAFITKQVQDRANEIEAEANILPFPNPDFFFASVGSANGQFNMEDAVENDILGSAFGKKGAKTRNGMTSLRIAFLPHDFSDGMEGKEGARRVLQLSCSIPMTAAIQKGYEEYQRAQEGKGIPVLSANPFLKNCVILRQSDSGVYSFGGMSFHVDDEMGIWWEEEDKT